MKTKRLYFYVSIAVFGLFISSSIENFVFSKGMIQSFEIAGSGGGFFRIPAYFQEECSGIEWHKITYHDGTGSIVGYTLWEGGVLQVEYTGYWVYFTEEYGTTGGSTRVGNTCPGGSNFWCSECPNPCMGCTS